MKPIINEYSMQFIQCGECDYERSLALPDLLERDNFDWLCPKCSLHWTGVKQKDGTIYIERSDRHRSRHYVLVETEVTLPPPEAAAETPRRSAAECQRTVLPPVALVVKDTRAVNGI